MKRYFEIVGKQQTIEFDIVDGSPASTASADDFSKEYHEEFREIDQAEYKQLTKKYKGY